MTKSLPIIAATAILSLASVAARAEEAVYPRTYTAEDCRDLDRQIDDSIRFANLDGVSAASLQTRRIGADEACFTGQYAVGARQLRDVLDDIIALGAQYRPVPLAPQAAAPPAGPPVAMLPPGSWREGCMDVVIDDGVLHAACLDRTGHYAASQLDLGSCRQSVSNQNGQLTCGEPRAGRSAVGVSSIGTSAAGAPTMAAPAPSRSTVTVTTVVAPPPGSPPPGSPPSGADAATMPAPEASAAGPSAPGALPPGNWIASCRNARMIGTILQSECQDRIGNWRLTAIDTRSCSQPIANRNGGLSCY